MNQGDEGTNAFAEDAAIGPGQSERLIPVVAGTTVMLQAIDATATATALPAIAGSLHVDLISASLSITAYLVGTALVVPVGGWLDERYGGRSVFRVAIGLVMLTSLACAAAPSLALLVAARFLEGAAVAVILPVGRLMVIRSTPRNKLIDAMTTFGTYGLMGPVLGPFIGGALVDLFSWRAIYLLNLPIGFFAFFAVTRFTRNQVQAEPRVIDVLGITLSGSGLALLVAGMELLGDGRSPVLAAVTASLGLAALSLLYVHARRASEPLIRLDLLLRPTFALSMWADFVMRLLIGSGPMLVALLLQVGFGNTAFRGGVILLGPALGALLGKIVVPGSMHRFGFRPTMVCGAALSGLMFSLLAFCSAATPVPLMVGVLTAYGLTRSMVMSGTTMLGFDEIAPQEMGAATSMLAIIQQLALVVGMCLATFLLRSLGGDQLDITALRSVIVIMGVLTCSSLFILMRLQPHAGMAMRTPRPSRVG